MVEGVTESSVLICPGVCLLSSFSHCFALLSGFLPLKEKVKNSFQLSWGTFMGISDCW